MMSLLLSASRSDALAYACGSARNSLPAIEANTVDAIKLASLALIINGEELSDDDVIAFTNRFEDIASYGEDGPWLFVCPRESLYGLADLAPGRVPEVAEAWAATEEARLDRWDVADTKKFLSSLSEFCSESVAAGKDLFLFVVP
jgi:hypothetical protein